MQEMNRWAKFEQSFGPLTIHERIDNAAALICFVLNRSLGGKANLDDFRPRYRAREKVDLFEFLKGEANR